MSVVLFGVGAIAFMAGAVMAAYGIPVREFSFGNTMILAGVIAMAGGLIVGALGLVVSQLQRLTEALTRGAPVRGGRALSPMDAGTRMPTAPARVPFPPRPKAEPKSEMPVSGPAGFALGKPVDDFASEYAAPTLPNPDEAPVTVDDEISLSPRHPFAPPAPTDLDEPLLPPPFPPRADHTKHDRLPDGEPPVFGAGWRTPPKAAPAKPPMHRVAAPPFQPPVSEPSKFEAFKADAFEEDSFKSESTKPESAKPESTTPEAAKIVPPPPPRQNTYFDSMWPAKPDLTAKPETTEEPESSTEPRPDDAWPGSTFEPPFAPSAKAAPKHTESHPTEAKAIETRPAEAKSELPQAHDDEAPAFAWGEEEPAPAEERRTVAILKSGVVDGMGYTLYVDGSIEAELPQGTLHFASINELRSHLEKTS